MPAAASLRWTAAPLLLLVLLCQLGFCLKSLPNSLAGNVDLRVFYTSGYLVGHGQGAHLYDPDAQREVQNALVSPNPRTLPFLYPAFAALLFVPLSLLSYKAAFVVFLLLNLAALFVTAHILRTRLALVRPTPTWLLALLFLALFPVSMALMQGQVTFLLLLLYTACFATLRNERYLLAGLLFSATLIKFQLTLPITALLLLWHPRGRMSLFAGFASGAAFLAGLSLAITGPGVTMQYLERLLHITHSTLQAPEQARQQYGMFAADMPNLHGLIFLLTHGRPIGTPLLILASALVFLWAVRQRRTPGASLGTALPIAMLLSYHLQAYDLTLLLLPLAVAAASLQGATPSRPLPSRMIALAVAILVLPIAPLLLVHGLCALFLVAIVAIVASLAVPGSDANSARKKRWGMNPTSRTA